MFWDLSNNLKTWGDKLKKKTTVHVAWGFPVEKWGPGFMETDMANPEVCWVAGAVLLASPLQLNKVLLTPHELFKENLEGISIHVISIPGRKSKYRKATSNGMLWTGKEQEKKKDVEMNHWWWGCYQRTGFGFLDYARMMDSWQG